MKQLKIGARVEVTRADGEKRIGYVQSGPLEYLLHIGEFYHIGDAPPAQDPETVYRRGRPKRGEIRLPKRTTYHEFGMYGREFIRPVDGHRRKQVLAFADRDTARYADPGVLLPAT